MQTTRQFYRVDRRKINIIRFIFEAYEGLAVVTTLDAAAGAISLAVAPGCEAMASSVMDDLAKKMMIAPMASYVHSTSEEH
jgi:hypothetical protein